VIIYVDGGAKKVSGTRTFDLSWGIVVHHNEQTVEHYGGYKGVDNKYGAHHEFVAFAAAVLHAKHAGVAFEDISFYCDDFHVCNAGSWFHLDNWVATSDVEWLKTRLLETCVNFFTPDLYDDLLDCLIKARFTKVKGHSDVIYNLRVDYLANYARGLLRDTPIQWLNFEAWLAKGFLAYKTPRESYIWFAAFSEPVN
jgi:ribonuclease HI